MFRGIFVLASWLALSLIGCGADDGNGDANAGGRAGSGGSSGTGGTSATGGGAPKCDGAFAVVPSPYAPNTTTTEWGGFAVDERGAVFSALADSSLTEDESAYDPVIMAADLSGNLTTLHTGPSLYGNFILRGDSVYMLAGPVTPDIVRLDRSGGTPVQVVEGTVTAGPVLHEDLIYYAKVFDSGIYRLDPETDASTLLVAREDEIVTLALDGNTLYWIESDGILEDTDYRLFSMPAAGGTPELLQSLPRAELALGNFRVIDGVLYGAEITADFDFVVTRTPIGGAPTIVEEAGGLPMVIAEGFAYYGLLSGGLIKAPLSFATKATIPGSNGRAIYSLAIGPDDLWYSEISCIYRTAK
jgi:hypothetical protein